LGESPLRVRRNVVAAASAAADGGTQMVGAAGFEPTTLRPLGEKRSENGAIPAASSLDSPFFPRRGSLFPKIRPIKRRPPTLSLTAWDRILAYDPEDDE
jgi:hypothetical protein